MAKLGPAHPEVASNHRARVAFQILTAAGALQAIGLEIRAGLMRQTPQGGRPNLLPNEGIQKLHDAINTLNDKLFTLVEGEVTQMKSDAALNPGMRGRYQDLWASYKSMKTLYTNTNRPAAQYTSQVRDLRAKYIRLVESLQKDVKIEVPPQLLTLLKTTLADGPQSQTVVAQIVPAPMQSRILRGRSRVIQRGPQPGQRPVRPRARPRRPAIGCRTCATGCATGGAEGIERVSEEAVGFLGRARLRPSLFHNPARPPGRLPPEEPPWNTACSEPPDSRSRSSAWGRRRSAGRGPSRASARATPPRRPGWSTSAWTRA